MQVEIKTLDESLANQFIPLDIEIFRSCPWHEEFRCTNYNNCGYTNMSPAPLHTCKDMGIAQTRRDLVVRNDVLCGNCGHPTEEYWNAKKHEGKLREKLKDPDFLAFAAMIDGVLVGYVTGNPFPEVETFHT